MKTFGVYPQTSGPKPHTIRVRTDNQLETFAYARKAQADKKILQLISSGYKFDATHETIRALENSV